MDMKSERYNLEKAQEEAQKLTRKVESGEVSDPTEAEKLKQRTESEEKFIDEKKTRKLLREFRYFHGRESDEVRSFINAFRANPSREIQENVIKSMLTIHPTEGAVFTENINDVISIQKTLRLSGEIIQQSLELQLALKKSFSNFQHDYVKNLIDAVGAFPLPKSFWQSIEFQDGLKKYWDRDTSLSDSHPNLDFIRHLINEYLPLLLTTIFPDPKIFNADERVRSKAKSLINIVLNYSSISAVALVADIASVFSMDKTDPSIEALLPKIEKGILSVIKENVDHPSPLYAKKRIEGAFHAREVFGFSKELGEDIGKRGMLEHISSYENFEGAKVIKEMFRFPDSIITDLFETAQKTKKWDSVIKLANHFPECGELYKNAIAKGREVISASQNTKERKEAIEMFAGLIINGDSQFLQDLVNIVSERSKNQEPKETKTGFTPIQEAAFAVLYRLDNPESNTALFSLLTNKTIPPVVKRSILTKLTTSGSSFQQEQGYAILIPGHPDLRSWLHSKELKDLNWDDLSFYHDIENIASSETRESSKLYASEVIAGFSLQHESCYEIWAQQYPDIPKDTFLLLSKILQANPSEEVWNGYRGDVMEKFQTLYKSLRREGSKRDLLLSAIASCLTINPELLNLVVDKLSDIDFGKKEDADKLARILKITAFLNSVQNIINHSDYEEVDYGEYGEFEGENEQKNPISTPDNIKEIFLRPITDLSELENLLSEAATIQIQEILPNEQITAEKVEKVIEQWADIEPIFTYLKSHPNLKTYIAEMFASFDSKENWKAWRYDLEDRTVKKQVGHLSPEQLEIWQNNHVAEVGDFEIKEGPLSKPEQVRRLLTDAIVRDRHINNEQAEGVRLPFAQRILEKALLGLDENIEQGQKNLAETTQQINRLASKLDILILSANSSRVEQTLNAILPPNKNLTPSSKIENSLKALRPFLPPEVFEGMWQTYKDIPAKTTVSGNILISPDTRQALGAKLQDIKQQADEISSSTIWQELELPPSVVPETSTIYQKRAELKAILEILRLADLSPRQIALNILTEGKKKEEGTAISSTLENLKKVFKDCAFTQDLKNVEFILKEQTQFTGKRRLVMVLSDNPSFLWQAGKYPIGNGSCQHYAEGSMSQSLMGYVGDAHIKVAYLFDINSLPENLKTKIKDGLPLGEIVDQASPPEILQAVVARSIVKIGKDEQNRPAIFMEPTYSVINKGDISMDRYFNLFTDLFVVEPMKSKLYRGSGSEKLNIPPSRNPEGQYEDGAVGNAQNAGMGIQTSSYSISAKSIGKDHTPTTEEELIIENMRRSPR